MPLLHAVQYIFLNITFELVIQAFSHARIIEQLTTEKISDLQLAYQLAPVFNGGQEFSIGAARCGHRFKGLDKLLLLPLVGQAGVEVRGCKTEEPLVLVGRGRGGRAWSWGRWLPVL